MRRMLGAVVAAVILAAPILTMTTGRAAADLDFPQCRNADLTASYRSTGAGAGHTYGKIRLTNTSDRACWTRGYGGLSYVGHGDGTQIGAAAVRTPSKVGKMIVLQPGERVVSVVDEKNAHNYPNRRCHRTHVDGFRVYVPDARRSQFVRHPTTGCAKAKVHLLSHKAYRRAG